MKQEVKQIATRSNCWMLDWSRQQIVVSSTFRVLRLDGAMCLQETKFSENVNKDNVNCLVQNQVVVLQVKLLVVLKFQWATPCATYVTWLHMKTPIEIKCQAPTQNLLKTSRVYNAPPGHMKLYIILSWGTKMKDHRNLGAFIVCEGDGNYLVW